MDADSAALDHLASVVRGSALVPEGSGGVALCSGGADSAAMLAGLARVAGPGRVLALHLDYRLRPDSGEDARTCAELCDRLGVELATERPELAEGNVQAAARELRYSAAERLRAERGLDWIATGHTRTDLAETVLYRLASSPGRRALLGLRPRRGAVIRPLLALGRGEVRELAAAAGLPFRDDPSNERPDYARNRIRNEVLPVLGEIGPAAERTIAETQAELREEGEALDAVVEAALADAGPDSISLETLEALHPAVARLALRSLAERVAGRPVPLGRERAAEVLRLARSPEGGVVELGGGVEAQVEQGHVRLAAGSPDPAEEARLLVPGSCRFGPWELSAEVAPAPADPRGSELAVLDADSIAAPLHVRAWRDGDRMRPIGLGGTKTLQDLFTDRKIPRSLRRTLPVVTSGDRIAWVAGVAVSAEFAASPGAGRAAILRATAGRA